MEASDNLYMTGLPIGCDENMLQEVFGQFGTVTSCKILPNPGIPGGSPAGFVRYATEAEATLVLQNLNQQVPPGFSEPVNIKYAVKGKGKGGGCGGCGGGGYGKWGGGDSAGWERPSPWQSAGGGGGADQTNVYVRGLPLDATSELVTQNFSEFGKIVSVKMLQNPKGGNTCAALVRFEQPDVAATVVSSLNGQQPEGFSEPLCVKYANTPGQPTPAWGGPPPAANGGWGGGKGGIPGGFGADTLVKLVFESGMMPGGGQKSQGDDCTLYVSGLPGDTSNVHLFQLFAPFGAIVSTHAKNGGEGDMAWAIGFINFLEPHSAQAAIAAFNGMQMPNGMQMKVSLKAAKGESKGQAPSLQLPGGYGGY